MASLYKKYLEYEDAGLVNIQTLNNLRIISYSRECQYSGAWDEYTISARGLIIDIAKNQIIGVPFPKFFNYSEYPPNANLGTPLHYRNKYDGSLGIVFKYNGIWNVATKKSFNSEQAKWAQQIINEVSDGLVDNDTLSFTHLFEIIYKENQIVVDYEEFEGLIYLGSYSNFTFGFYDLMTDELAQHPKIKHATHTPVISLQEVQDHVISLEETNNEGVVVYFDKVGPVKFKTKSYQALHKLVSDITASKVWALLDQFDFDEVKALSLFPEEFRKDVSDIAKPMIVEYHSRYVQILDNFDSLKKLSATRKEFALGAKVFHPAVTSGLFMMLDGRSLDEIKKMISNSLKP